MNRYMRIDTITLKGFAKSIVFSFIDFYKIKKSQNFRIYLILLFIHVSICIHTCMTIQYIHPKLVIKALSIFTFSALVKFYMFFLTNER
jgi:hypothetical protein